MASTGGDAAPSRSSPAQAPAREERPLSEQPTASPAPAGATVEPCTNCAAPLASDQRYCLECGARRAYLSSVLLDPRKPSAPATPDAPPGAAALPPVAQPASAAAPARAASTTAVIAGVGVLLLSMGIGVLIGRASSEGNGRAAAAPAQVISVATPTTGTATTPAETPPPTTSTPSTTPKPGKFSPGAGQSPSKPAPPSAVKNLRSGGSGQSYEQKSKNLPDEISTG